MKVLQEDGTVSEGRALSEAEAQFVEGVNRSDFGTFYSHQKKELIKGILEKFVLVLREPETLTFEHDADVVDVIPVPNIEAPRPFKSSQHVDFEA